MRSRGTGAPIAAHLEVVETKSRVDADAQGLFLVDVPPGSYTVSIAAPGYRPQTRQVRVKGGDRAIFNVDLHQQ